jgi:DNA replication and repair protein RecF
MLRWNQEAAIIDLTFFRHEIENRLIFKLKNKQNKEIKHNDCAIKPREVIGCFNAVLFSPEDLLLIKGAPAGRRRFLDGEISQASPGYYRQLLQYNRIINQRNHLLKKIKENKADIDLLEPFDEQAARTASYLVLKRQEAIKKLAMLANLMHRKITDSKENLSLSYYCHGVGQVLPGNPAVWYKQKLFEIRNEDIAKGSTGVGPHRDDLILSVNEINLKTYGSQGQQRTGILALKLAELEFIKSETGEYPVLLLDDVMSELDVNRREQLLNFIRDKIQTFITATDEKYFPTQKVGKYYQVVKGTVME